MAMGTGARWAAFGMGLAGAGALKMGISFNSTMEQNQVAFSQFLGSGQKTQEMLDSLFETAKETPFSFSEITTAARKFLAFGFTAKETMSHLKSVGDAVAGIGGGGDEIRRMVIALGQMQAKGRIMGQELLQLTELGIPAYKILKEELGLSADEMKRVGDQGISAEKGIAALMRGIDKTFGGAAERQSRTLKGQWEKFKDTFAQTMGLLTKPLFDILRKNVLPAFNRVMQEVQENAPRWMRGFWGGLTGDVGLSGYAGQLAFRVGEVLRSAFKVAEDAFAVVSGGLAIILTKTEDIGDIASDVWADFKSGVEVLAPIIGTTLYLALESLGFIIEFVSDHYDTLSTAVYAAGAAFAAYKLVLMATVFWQRLVAAATFISYFYRAATAVGFLTAAMVALDIAMAANPVGLAVAGVVLFAAGMYLAYKRVEWFRDLINATWPYLIALIAPIAVPIIALIRHFDSVKSAGVAAWEWIKASFEEAYDFIQPKIQWLIDKVKWIIAKAGPLKDAADFAVPGGGKGLFSDEGVLGIGGVPFLATGGYISQGGWSWVGENGPEPVWLPSGATVLPNRMRAARTRPLGSGEGSGSPPLVAEPLLGGEGGVLDSSSGVGARSSGRGEGPQIIQLVVGRKVLAEVTADDAADKKARRGR